VKEEEEFAKKEDWEERAETLDRVLGETSLHDLISLALR
jgi:hypothetical protein